MASLAVTAPTYPTRLRRRAVRLYSKGRTAREVATELGIDNTTVINWARADAETRRRGPRGRTDVSDAQVIEARDELGLPWRQVATMLGMSYTGVRKRYAAINRRQ